MKFSQRPVPHAAGLLQENLVADIFPVRKDFLSFLQQISLQHNVRSDAVIPGKPPASRPRARRH